MVEEYKPFIPGMRSSAYETADSLEAKLRVLGATVPPSMSTDRLSSNFLPSGVAS